MPPLARGLPKRRAGAQASTREPMNLFALLIHLSLLTVVLAGIASIAGELGVRWDARWLKRRLLPRALRRLR